MIWQASSSSILRWCPQSINPGYYPTCSTQYSEERMSAWCDLLGDQMFFLCPRLLVCLTRQCGAPCRSLLHARSPAVLPGSAVPNDSTCSSSFGKHVAWKLSRRVNIRYMLLYRLFVFGFCGVSCGALFARWWLVSIKQRATSQRAFTSIPPQQAHGLSSRTVGYLIMPSRRVRMR